MSQCIYQAREPDIQPNNQSGEDLSSSGGFSVHYPTKLYTSDDSKSSSNNKKGVTFLPVPSLTLLQDDDSVFWHDVSSEMVRRGFHTRQNLRYDVHQWWEDECLQTDQGLLLLCLPVKCSLLTGTKHIINLICHSTFMVIFENNWFRNFRDKSLCIFNIWPWTLSALASLLMMPMLAPLIRWKHSLWLTFLMFPACFKMRML